MTNRAPLSAFALGCAMVGVFGCSTEPAPPPPSKVTDIIMATDSVTIEVGDTVTIRARATTGAQWVDDVSFTWTSYPTSVASVSSTGLVTGLSAGTAAVTARFGGIARTVQVQVRRTLARIIISQDSIDVTPGWRSELTAFGEDAAGHRLRVPISWKSSDRNVVLPPAAGTVRGGRVGRATLTARSGNVSATVAAVVRPRSGVLTLFAFSSGLGELYELALDGSAPVRWPVQPSDLPSLADAGLDWSRTGRLLYGWCGESPSRVCIVAPSGATERVAMPIPGSAPSWWSDSRRIVFSDGEDGRILDPVTGRLETIPLGSADEIRVALDGNTLAFTRWEDDQSEGLLPVLWIKDASGIRRAAPGCQGPDWSPDGTKVAAACGRSIYVGRIGAALTWDVPTLATRVRWGPSGKLIAFLGSDGVLAVSNPDGTGLNWLRFAVPDRTVANFAWRIP